MSVELAEALRYEASTLDIESMMSSMLESYKEETGTKTEVTPLQIRRMALAAKYLKKEAEDLTEMKKAVAAEWDRKIQDKLNQVQNINDFIKHWLENEHKGEKLTVDFGSISLRKTKPKIVFNKDKVKEARDFLAKTNTLQAFLKPGELDDKLLMERIQEAIKDELDKTMESIFTQYQLEHPDEKLSKAKQKEMTEVELVKINQRYAEYYKDFIDLQPEQTSLSIRMS